jgi:hypothetical protein
MFALTQKPKFKYPVEFEISGENGPEKCKFTGIFLRTAQDEMDKVMEKGITDEELVRQKLVGWEDVEGEFNPENLKQMLALDGMRAVIARAYLEGNRVAVRKN